MIPIIPRLLFFANRLSVCGSLKVFDDDFVKCFGCGIHVVEWFGCECILPQLPPRASIYFVFLPSDLPHVENVPGVMLSADHSPRHVLRGPRTESADIMAVEREGD